jgi:hypothetical protein
MRKDIEDHFNKTGNSNGVIRGSNVKDRMAGPAKLVDINGNELLYIPPDEFDDCYLPE